MARVRQFLILSWQRVDSLHFLNFQKYIVTVSYILPNFRNYFAFFSKLVNEWVFYIKKSLITYENHRIIPKTMHFIQEKIYHSCLLTKLFIQCFLWPKKSMYLSKLNFMLPFLAIDCQLGHWRDTAKCIEPSALPTFSQSHHIYLLESNF